MSLTDIFYFSNIASLNNTANSFFFFFNDTATTEIYTLSLHDALPIFRDAPLRADDARRGARGCGRGRGGAAYGDGLAARPPGADRAGACPPLPERGRLRPLRPLLQLPRGPQVSAGGARLLARRQERKAAD